MINEYYLFSWWGGCGWMLETGHVGIGWETFPWLPFCAVLNFSTMSMYYLKQYLIHDIKYKKLVSV